VSTASGSHPLLGPIAERTLRWRHYAWYWGDAIAIDGLLAAGDAVPRARGLVAEQLSRWAATTPDNFDDPLAPALAIATLVAQGELPAPALDRFLESLDRLPTLPSGLPALEPHRHVFRFGFCIDALYHLPTALAAVGVDRGEPARVRQAVNMMRTGVSVLACPTGWSQWYDETVERNNGIAWSRGIGWAVLGLVDLLTQLDRSSDRDAAGSVAEFEDLTAQMLERLARTQQADGNWAGVLDDAQAKSEASTAAFYVAAARDRRTRSFWTSPVDALAKAEASVVDSVDEGGIVNGVSADVLPGWDIRRYREFHVEPSPWAQGGALRALAVMTDAPAVAP
jgi:hypothetical protein